MNKGFHGKPLKILSPGQPDRKWSLDVVESHLAAAQSDLLYDDGFHLSNLGDPDPSWVPDSGSMTNPPESGGHAWEWVDSTEVCARDGRWVVSRHDDDNMTVAFQCWVCSTCESVFDTKSPGISCDLAVAEKVMEV